MLLYKNKKAYFDYTILKEFKAGIVLTGCEVKSCRLNQVNLKGSYVVFENNQLILKGSNISKYKYTNDVDYDPARNRVLLLEYKTIQKILNELNTSGVTLIPLELFTEKRLIKIKIALARGKKMYDKRESLKKKDFEKRSRNSQYFLHK